MQRESHVGPQDLELSPPRRGERDHTRWVQSSLNRILGLRLAVDGINGPATRSAIRSFQQRQGLSADGVVRPQTERAIVAALRGSAAPRARSTSGVGRSRQVAKPRVGVARGVASRSRCQVLSGFDFDRDRLKPQHQRQLNAIARQIAANKAASVRVVGHTDPVGTDTYNLALGRRRAERAATELRKALDRVKPGLSRSVTLKVESRGEREPIPGDAARSRRVELCFNAPPATCVIRPVRRLETELESLTPTRTLTATRSRPCCMLAPKSDDGNANSNLLEPSRLGAHNGTDEANGLIYSGKAGFLDLGHIRELCDHTKLVFDQLTSGVTPGTVFVKGRAPFVGTELLLGEATMLKCPVDPLHVARSIAFDAGMGHEIISYDQFFPGGHNSSFSPEDLPSNYLGTLLADRAIRAGGNFNRAVNTELGKLLRELDAQSAVESRRAFDLINGRWVRWSDATGIRSIVSRRYLQRRNFGREPFKAGHASDQPTPAFVVEPFRPLTDIYRYVHKESGNIPRSDYGRQIERIKQDAASIYGTDFDKP